MGDFSRDPKTRAADARAKHYVGVRLQQGVPLVDADWNELEDLRRLELEDIGRWMLGNGVPVGSDGFRVAAIDGGGVNTIILAAKQTTPGLSQIKVDLGASTAAAALGFDATNSAATRFGSSPAQITSNKIQPFTLANGSTLVVAVDNQVPQTVTFTAAAFANIAAATAAEVVAAITPAIGKVSAAVGVGNDFIIKGGDRTTANAGRILVDGQMVHNEGDLKYSDQPLYQNKTLAEIWGVDQVEALTTPAVNDQYTVYIDVWLREVGLAEDPEIVDQRIGVETAMRLRREWAVRVARASDYPGIVAGKSEGHAFYVLAQLQRTGTSPAIQHAMILDERDTDASLRRAIAYRGADNTVLVSSASFKQMLVECRDNIRDFIQYLTTKFVAPNAAYVAAEVIGIEALSAIAALADHGIALLNAQSLDTKGAFAYFGQLLDAEKRFVTVWKTAVLPLNKPAGKVYETAYQETVARVEALLIGPAPTSFISVARALEQRNLWEATRAQGRINVEFGEEIDRPKGILLLTYLGSQTPTIPKNQNFDLRYRISGSVTPDDDIDVSVFATGWQTSVKKKDGTLPFSLRMGPGPDSDEFIVTVRSPNSDTAETQISLQVNAHRNQAGLSHISAQKTLKVGSPPPPSEEDYTIIVATITNATLIGGTWQVKVGDRATINFRLVNNSDSPVTVNLEFEPANQPPWTIQKGAFQPNGQVVAAHSQSVNFNFFFTAPANPNETLAFSLRARDSTSNNVLAESRITLASVATQ